MSDILVIGDGIIGLLTARKLVQADAEVTLVEMGETGRESSWAGGGIISPLYPWRYADSVTALAGWSQHHYPRLCAELHEETHPAAWEGHVPLLQPETHPSGAEPPFTVEELGRAEL